MRYDGKNKIILKYIYIWVTNTTEWLYCMKKDFSDIFSEYRFSQRELMKQAHAERVEKSEED